jgi:hypothetical protein
MIIKDFKDGYVEYKCDICGDTYKVKLSSLKKYNRLDKQICRKCSIKLNDVVDKRRRTCIEKYGVDNPMKVSSISGNRSNNQDTNRTDFDTVKKSFEKAGYTLLSLKYKNRTQRLDFICDKGHKHYITWSSWLRGSRCNLCKPTKVADKRRCSISEIKRMLETEGYTLLSENYVNRETKIQYKCPNGHTGSTTLCNWIYNTARCNSCSHKVSKAEIEVYDFIKFYFPEAKHNNKDIISPLELDIVIPSKKIAIEYCGLYWHSYEAGKERNYHLDKLNRCKNKGYRLITIFEDEWLSKQNIVKSILLNILGINQNKVYYARNCIVRPIKAKEARKFCNENHIQGYSNASCSLGAFYKDELLSVMTFSKPTASKNMKNIEDGTYELNRFCNKINTRIIGVASKLLKYFTKNYIYRKIISYADRRWSEGSLYYKLGFEFIHNIPPSYWYIEGYSRIHRFNFRKSKLKKMKNYNPSFTEKQIMTLEGYNRIYDCGNIKFEKCKCFV